jgi:hypothetical protein
MPPGSVRTIALFPENPGELSRNRSQGPNSRPSRDTNPNSERQASAALTFRGSTRISASLMVLFAGVAYSLAMDASPLNAAAGIPERSRCSNAAAPFDAREAERA